jgi:hypothetical protein
MYGRLLSKYRLPTTREREEYETSLRCRVDKLLLKALAKHEIKAVLDPETKELVTADFRLAEVDQWRTNLLDHSRYHRVYAAGEVEAEVIIALEDKPKISLKSLLRLIRKCGQSC